MSSVDLTNELRLAKPRAPEQLRERVLALRERPVREPRFSFSLPPRYTVRRVALVAVPAVVALGAEVDQPDVDATLLRVEAELPRRDEAARGVAARAAAGDTRGLEGVEGPDGERHAELHREALLLGDGLDLSRAR